MKPADMTEKEWDAQLFNTKKGLAPTLGWRLTYHTLRSKGSTSGFPDRVLVRDRLIACELKTMAGKVSDSQREWLDGLAKAGVETYLFRPSDLDEIARILSKRWHYIKGQPPALVLSYGSGATQDCWQPRSLWIPGLGRADTTIQQTLAA